MGDIFFFFFSLLLSCFSFLIILCAPCNCSSVVAAQLQTRAPIPVQDTLILQHHPYLYSVHSILILHHHPYMYSEHSTLIQPTPPSIPVQCTQYTDSTYTTIHTCTVHWFNLHHSIQYSVHGTQYIDSTPSIPVQCTQHTVHNALIQPTPPSIPVQCTQYIDSTPPSIPVHSTQYTVHSTQYTVHWFNQHHHPYLYWTQYIESTINATIISCTHYTIRWFNLHHRP